MSKNSQFVLQEDLLEALILLLSQASIQSIQEIRSNNDPKARQCTAIRVTSNLILC